ncbi:MAG: DUF975 family protein [Bacteroidales bacterium]|nr:DUF975 family protein [Bacteroidales bacterium]
MKSNQEYKNAALAALKGKWAPAVLCAVVYMVITLCVSYATALFDPATTATGVVMTASLVTMLISLLVVSPLGVGYYNAHKDLLLTGDDKLIANSFKTGFANWGHNVWGMLLMGIFVFLWTLLLIIPGIIKGFAYSLVPYILVDKPELSANEAINLSMKMMKGHKFDFFWLCLSFIGWILLAILTLGIGLFWLLPYMYTAYAAFYQDVKAEYEAKTNTVNN